MAMKTTSQAGKWNLRAAAFVTHIRRPNRLGQYRRSVPLSPAVPIGASDMHSGQAGLQSR